MALSQEELERYSRHIILKGVGLSGQKKLLQGKECRNFSLSLLSEHSQRR